MMPIRLSDDLLRAIDESDESPLRLLDPTTNTTYVLLPADAYTKLLERFRQDRIEEEAWLDAAEEAQLGWMRENPY